MGEGITLEAPSPPGTLPPIATPLFPLPLTAPPATKRNSGHRRRLYQRALATHSIANLIIRALNTLFFNYPAAAHAQQLRSADPSLPQSRLLQTILDAAAVFLNASRQCFDSPAPTTAHINYTGMGGVVTLIPGCPSSVPRPRSGASSFTILSATPTQISREGEALFIFDDVHTSSVPPGPAMPAPSAPLRSDNDCLAQDPLNFNDVMHHSLQLFDSIPSSHGGESLSTYSDTLPRGLVSLRASRVALPSHLNNVSMLSLLPDNLSLLYNSPEVLLLPSHIAQQNLRAAKLKKPRVLAEHGEYVALVRRMIQLGMLSMTTSPSCVNGLFGVPKGEQTRLILDARPANCYFVRPPAVVLPSPSHLAALRIPHGRPLFVAKMDLSNFYHQLTLPEWIRPYFALPALSAQDVLNMGEIDVSDEIRQALREGHPIHPCCATLPMGFSHSVFIAQSVHEHVMYSSGVLNAADNIVYIRSPWIDRPLHALYIDDNILVGTNGDQLSQLYDRVSAAYHAAQLPINDKKGVRPSLDAVTTLGVDIDGRRGTISLNITRLNSVVQATQTLLSQRWVTGKELASIVGAWTWPMLLRRPTLAAFKHVYRYTQLYPDTPRELWKCVRRELRVVMAFAPLLTCNLRRQSWLKIVATDASSTGAGVVAARWDDSMQSILWPVMTQPDCSLLPQPSPVAQETAWPILEGHQPVKWYHLNVTSHALPEIVHGEVDQLLSASSLHWSTVISSTWKYPQHINELELQSVLLGLRWMLSHPEAVHRQLHLLVDSSSVHFSVNKGRSSSPRMLTLLRRYAAFLLAADITVLSGWVPSELNPADSASRKYMRTMLSSIT